MESHNWVNTTNLTSCVFPNGHGWPHKMDQSLFKELPEECSDDEYMKKEHGAERNQVNIQHVEDAVFTVEIKGRFGSVPHNPDTL